MDEIRRYTKQDLSACAALYRAAFAAEPWREEWTDELAENRIRELMLSPLSRGFLLLRDGVPVGLLAGEAFSYLYGRVFFVHEFCVAPDVQRSGIGTALLNAVRAELTAEGFAGMFLNTRHGYPSEAFYLKNGFVRAEDMVTLYLHLK